MNDFAITIDTDWAPDEVISQIADRLAEAKVKSTWFITHNSPEIEKLKQYPKFFELGLHPNFAKGSSQGNSPQEIIRALLRVVPDAKLIRTHSLIQSTELLKMIQEEFYFLTDISLFLPHAQNLRPHKIFLSENKSLLRLPYFWEDDEELNRLDPILDINHSSYHQPGLKIFNFHPIHIFLNSRNLDIYEKMKKKLNYPKVSLIDLKPYIYKGKGVESFFKEILRFISKNNFKSYTISDLIKKIK